MNVSKVIPSTRNRLAGAAFQIDQLVEDQLREKINGPTRWRATKFSSSGLLDIAGRIPTLQEAKKFLDSANEDKRENLIDQLRESRLCQQHVQLLGGHA